MLIGGERHDKAHREVELAKQSSEIVTELAGTEDVKKQAALLDQLKPLIEAQKE